MARTFILNSYVPTGTVTVTAYDMNDTVIGSATGLLIPGTTSYRATVSAVVDGSIGYVKWFDAGVFISGAVEDFAAIVPAGVVTYDRLAEFLERF